MHELTNTGDDETIDARIDSQEYKLPLTITRDSLDKGLELLAVMVSEARKGKEKDGPADLSHTSLVSQIYARDKWTVVNYQFPISVITNMKDPCRFYLACWVKNNI